MGNKSLAFLMMWVISGSCITPAKYLPTPSTIDVNQYGSYIEIFMTNSSYLKGELIAIDSNSIVVLNEEASGCKSIDMAEVRSFTLMYAIPKNYGWTIPASAAVSLAHGYLGIVTLPVNLVVTIAVTTAGNKAFTYNQGNMTFDKLKMFARFPQGIPPQISMAEIK